MADINSTKIAEQPLFFKAGRVIYPSGKAFQSLYLVKKGEVLLMKFANQHLHVFQICGEGEVLNEVDILLKTIPEHCAIAKTDVEIVPISVNDIENVISKTPKWIPGLFQTLCKRLMDSQEIIHEHNLNNGELGPGFILSKEDEKKYIQALADHNGAS